MVFNFPRFAKSSERSGVHTRFDGSVFSLNVLDCHLVHALHTRSLFKIHPKTEKIRGIASSVSTTAHVNTVPGSPASTSRSSLPTCTPPTMSRLFLMMRSQASEQWQSKPMVPVAPILPNQADSQNWPSLAGGPELAADIWPMAKISIIHLRRFVRWRGCLDADVFFLDILSQSITRNHNSDTEGNTSTVNTT